MPRSALRLLTALVLLVPGSAFLFAVTPDADTDTTAPAVAPAETQAQAEAPPVAPAPEPGPAKPVRRDPPELTGSPEIVYVIPIEGPISTPNLYVLRRGLKEAIDRGVSIVVLEINTPGGSVATMMEMIDAIHRFDGRLVAYINRDAMSAGAYISLVCDEVWFHPYGTVGAAAMVTSTGDEVPETMKLKIESFLNARIRAYTRDEPFRAQILRAMSDPSFVLEVDGQVIKKEGELLTLTADEASKTYGDPPKPLLAAGMASDIDHLLRQLVPDRPVQQQVLAVTWAERTAKFLDAIAPMVLGIAFLLLVIEFKTPGWGIFGTTGIVLLVAVFLSNYVAGLAGYEPLLLCMLGLVLFLIELFLLPGVGFLAIPGMFLIVASVLWSLADLWPGVAPDGRPGITIESFGSPVLDLLMAILIFLGGLALIFRYLPRTSIYGHLVLAGGVAAPDPVTAGGGLTGAAELPAIGSRGVAVTDLRPGGEVEFDGHRFEAIVSFGSIDRGEAVVVTAHRSLGLEVARAESRSASVPASTSTES